jgi:hypothetical protein
MDAPAGLLGADPLVVRQRHEQLRLRPAQRRTERDPGECVGQPQQRHELGLRERQTGQVGGVALEDADPTVAPRLGVDGDASGAQGLQVAVDRPDGHLETLGEVGGGHPAAALEQEHDRQEPVGAHPSPLRWALHAVHRPSPSDDTRKP